MASCSRWVVLVAAGGAWAASLLGQVPALVTSPEPFIGITPCRIADTRDVNRPPGYGPPSISPGVANGRTFVLAGQCGIPGEAQAVSLNVTAVDARDFGYLLLYPQGGALPGVSTLNYLGGQTVANAAIVPLGSGGGITVIAVVSGTDLIIDTNGYYGAAAAGQQNTFLGLSAGNSTTTASGNTAVGNQTLSSVTTGQNNTAVGFSALVGDTSGNSNTAGGRASLSWNTTGYENTAVGSAALSANTTGAINTAVGVLALGGSTRFQNTAVGSGSLSNLTDAIDADANSSLGFGAGSSNTLGLIDLYLAHPGTAPPFNDVAVIRIGTMGTHNRTFIAGIRGVTVPGGIPVQVDSTGQLGTASSSVRFKEDVRDMADSSGGLMKLRPVSFRYKTQSDDRTQFGLLAEEVEEVLPDLVACDPEGQAETVMYQELPAMLLNELQKQQRVIERQEIEALARQKRIERQRMEAEAVARLIGELESRISTLESKER